MVIKKNLDDSINLWINILKPSNVEWVLDNDMLYYINKMDVLLINDSDNLKPIQMLQQSKVK